MELSCITLTSVAVAEVADDTSTWLTPPFPLGVALGGMDQIWVLANATSCGSSHGAMKAANCLVPLDIASWGWVWEDASDDYDNYGYVCDNVCDWNSAAELSAFAFSSSDSSLSLNGIRTRI